MAFFVGSVFDDEALNLLRGQGCIPVLLNALLGVDLTEALKQLVSLLSKTAMKVEDDPEKIGIIFNKLSAIEGAADNLRGPLFELIVAHCVAGEGGQIDLQKQIGDPESNEAGEIDVLRFTPSRDVTAYECKGNRGDVVVWQRPSRSGSTRRFQGRDEDRGPAWEGGGEAGVLK